MRVAKKLIEDVVTELVGAEALPIIFYLRGKTKISEFIIAEELDMEIHRARNLLYRLLEHNVVFFHRKKDKIKGWYICYWDFNESIITYLAEKIRTEKITKLQERLAKEQGGQFFMCRNACARMDFEKAIEFSFKCPECGEIMHQQDNARTIEFLMGRIKELQDAEPPKEEQEKTPAPKAEPVKKAPARKTTAKPTAKTTKATKTVAKKKKK
jgi:transcription initiation factor TFIIE subunit alpha